ncbi:hypothetical protein [Ornithinimicrobium avium]|nr:hypothetical protein [Ornithinimicrobium avium]
MTQPRVLCATCGVENDSGEEVCTVCADERQYLPSGGQRWTTLAELAAGGCRVEVIERDARAHRRRQPALEAPGFLDDAAG